MTTMPAQPRGHKDDPGATATLMAGANPAAVPARCSHSSLAAAISAGTGAPGAGHEACSQNPRTTTY